MYNTLLIFDCTVLTIHVRDALVCLILGGVCIICMFTSSCCRAYESYSGVLGGNICGGLYCHHFQSYLLQFGWRKICGSVEEAGMLVLLCPQCSNAVCPVQYPICPVLCAKCSIC